MIVRKVRIGIKLVYRAKQKILVNVKRDPSLFLKMERGIKDSGKVM